MRQRNVELPFLWSAGVGAYGVFHVKRYQGFGRAAFAKGALFGYDVARGEENVHLTAAKNARLVVRKNARLVVRKNARLAAKKNGSREWE